MKLFWVGGYEMGLGGRYEMGLGGGYEMDGWI